MYLQYVLLKCRECVLFLYLTQQIEVLVKVQSKYIFNIDLHMKYLRFNTWVGDYIYLTNN